MAQRYKLTLEYDGTDFAGWQRQALGVTTVQGVVEEAIAQFTREDVATHAAGRTDSGVHALGQVAHVDLSRDDVPAETMRDAINFFVRPHRVVVVANERVSGDFHARFDAKSRAYRYRIVNRRAPPMLDGPYAWHIVKPLDVAAMQRAADTLLGEHDFSTFRAQFCQAKSPVRTLDLLRVEQDGDLITFTTRARSFLYHQVRNMVGTLAMVGTGKWSHEDFARAFAARDRTQAGQTAPPQGLFFLGPTY